MISSDLITVWDKLYVAVSNVQPRLRLCKKTQGNIACVVVCEDSCLSMTENSFVI